MNSVTKLIITIITTLIVVIGVMVPIIGGLDDNIKSVYQNTTERYLLSDNNLNLELEYLGEGDFLINGKPFDGEQRAVIAGNGLYINMYSGGAALIDIKNNISHVYSDIGTVISIENGNYTHTLNGTEYTGTLDTLLYPDENGDYGAYQGQEITVDKEDPIYLVSNYSNPKPKFILTMVDGTETRSEALMAPVTSSTDSFSEYTGTFTVNYTSTPSEDGLTNTYSSMTFTCDDGDGNIRIYAPVKYHVMDSTAEAVKSIVNILPLIILIGLIIVAGYAIASATRNKTDI